MGTDNVAMVFAPNILRPQGPQDQSTLLNDTGAVKDILRTLIEELAFMRAGVMRSRKNIAGGSDTVVRPAGVRWSLLTAGAGRSTRVAA